MSTKVIQPIDRDEHNELALRVQSLEALVLCKRCRGSGSIPTPDGPDECPECHGARIARALLDLD